MKWYFKVLRQYADFETRARRREFWMFSLVNSIVLAAGALFSSLLHFYTGQEIIYSPYILYVLFVFVPSLAVCARRMHDQGKTGWYTLAVFLLPGVGLAWILVLAAREGEPGKNKYGKNPRDRPYHPVRKQTQSALLTETSEI